MPPGFAERLRHYAQDNGMTDYALDSLERRISDLEEVAAARWPRRLVVAFRLGRSLRRPVAPDPGGRDVRRPAASTRERSCPETASGRRPRVPRRGLPAQGHGAPALGAGPGGSRAATPTRPGRRRHRPGHRAQPAPARGPGPAARRRGDLPRPGLVLPGLRGQPGRAVRTTPTTSTRPTPTWRSGDRSGSR